VTEREAAKPAAGGEIERARGEATATLAVGGEGDRASGRESGSCPGRRE